jgi:homoserine O-succinyltransferase
MSTILGHSGEVDGPCIRIGLVNNMPDAALARTELQFQSLLVQAAPGVPVQVSLFTLPGVPRGDAGRHHLEAQRYRSSDAITDSPLNALIVTGAEPRVPNLEDEPFWGAMTALLDRLQRTGQPTLFSCLAAHAAVLHFDGLRRRRLAQKRFGVFEHVKARQHVLTDGLKQIVRVAHSRCNELSEDDLEGNGYRVLTHAPEAGVDLFVKSGRDSWLFCQGHAEYDADSLGQEYRRDVRRFLAGAREQYPAIPRNYFGERAVELLMRFESRARSRRSESLMADFPTLAHSYTDYDASKSSVATILRAWLQGTVRGKYAMDEKSVRWRRNYERTAVSSDNFKHATDRPRLGVFQG